MTTHDATQRFIDALSTRWTVKSYGTDRYRAQCPAHDGEDLNLSIARGDQGVLVKCFSHECTTDAIVAAVGLTLGDLFDRDGEALYDYGPFTIRRTRKPAPPGKTEGKLVRPTQAGVIGESTPLWRAPGALPFDEVDAVALTEGEKAADALQRLGAVCVASWQGGWTGARKADLTPLAGKRVFIVPDRDEEGMKAARILLDRLQGIAREVHVRLVPETFGDFPKTLTDPADLWLAGGTLEDLEQINLTPEPDRKSTTNASIPDEFWEARPTLSAVRQQARARRVSPNSTLGAVLAMIVARVDPKVALPAIVGGKGSLNLFVNLVGVSGGGKGASIAAAADLLDFSSDCLVRVDHRTLGSGEGISAAFVERVKTEEGTDLVHHTDGVLFEVSEVDTLAALGSRSGSTIMPELRKMWSGERLGFQNRDRGTSLPVAAHSYRAALIVGVQPARSAAILDDAAGGTPQRFVWLSTEDPDAPDLAPPAPEQIKWENPSERTIPTTENVRGMRVCDLAWETIEQAQVQRLRGDGLALDGHSLLSRLKVAAALALLEMRGDVNDEDWRLAGLIMEHSDHTRQKCIDALSAASREAHEFRAELRADAAVKADDHLVAKCAERIVGKLSTEWTGAASIRRTITVKLREHFEQAVAELVQAGVVEEIVDSYNGQERTRYRLANATGETKPSPVAVSPQKPRNHAEVRGDSEGETKSPPLPETVTR